jgi:hypothetical protein
MMQAMHVSCDRVFAPPKSVTQNIEKSGIVRKAKVVSAANADDRNAAFEGSKRVRIFFKYIANIGTRCLQLETVILL